MKVPGSIRQLYEDQRVSNDRLRVVIDERMRGLKHARWHYESRVKELPSFALKIESGRFGDPRALEDFFACSLVVANATEIDEAERLVRGTFAVKERRPPRADRTHKAPDSFPFDDLRLYVSLPENPATPPTDLAGIVFEVQIKTFLQHAWSIATHDLLYKTDDANWRKERIASQIKAMLEHAEVSILEAEQLAACGVLAKEDSRTAATKRGIALVKAQWSEDELPADVRRLADNITGLMDALRLEPGRLEEILNEGKVQRAGAHPSNLSPYTTVVQYLFTAEREKVLSLLSAERARRRVLIPEEIEASRHRSRAAEECCLCCDRCGVGWRLKGR
jgi:ppGpp synthetase/RelA/SpoT-type nucleotidyltranferase